MSATTTKQVEMSAPAVDIGVVNSTSSEVDAIELLGYRAELRHNRTLATLLFQAVAMYAIPFGVGTALISAVYGGGQLSIFLGFIVVMCLNECVALSLAELASRYPTSGGCYYWAFQLMVSTAEPDVAQEGSQTSEQATKLRDKQLQRAVLFSYINGFILLVAEFTICLSVNFAFATFISGVIGIYQEDVALPAWVTLLIFYAICLLTFLACAFCNQILPYVDTIAAIWTLITILVILIALPVKAAYGRHSVGYTLGHYDDSFSGWGSFTFFIGLLPTAYATSAVGLISAMAEECDTPEVTIPRTISFSLPISAISGLFFVIPIAATLPPLDLILKAPAGQALPHIFHLVMGSKAGGLALSTLILIMVVFCTIPVTNATSRYAWAFSRDRGIPGSKLWSEIHPKLGIPLNAMMLLTVFQMLMGLISLGSPAAFNAFLSVGTIAIAASYLIPIIVSVSTKRYEVQRAPWRLPNWAGWTVNIIALAWICFQAVLFSMPTARTGLTAKNMNYGSVVLAGFGVIGIGAYFLHTRKVFKGPPIALI